MCYRGTSNECKGCKKNVLLFVLDENLHLLRLFTLQIHYRNYAMNLPSQRINFSHLFT